MYDNTFAAYLLISLCFAHYGIAQPDIHVMTGLAGPSGSSGSSRSDRSDRSSHGGGMGCVCVCVRLGPAGAA